MHPYLEYLYVKALREERERQADQARLVALAHRLRSQQLPAKKRRAFIRIWPGRRTAAARRSRGSDLTVE